MTACGVVFTAVVALALMSAGACVGLFAAAMVLAHDVEDQP